MAERVNHTALGELWGGWQVGVHVAAGVAAVRPAAAIEPADHGATVWGGVDCDDARPAQETPP